MRSRTNTWELGVVELFFTLVTSAGLGLSMDTLFPIARGPFLGGSSLDPFPMTAVPAVFVTGTVVFTWGSTRLFDVGTSA